jgi:hypothetical protein
MAKGFKTGGRSKGTPNKTTAQLKKMLSAIIDDELKELPEQLEKMKPYQRADILTKLIQYVIPKAEMIEDDEGNGEITPIKIEIVYADKDNNNPNH